MLKRSLIAIVAVALVATMANAGTIKTHDWPCQFVPVEITSIPVLMDVGYYVRVVDQSKKIKMNQKTGEPTNFKGCVDLEIKTNFNLTLSCSITPKGNIAADAWSCYFDPASEANVDAPGNANVTVCAEATNAKIENLPAQSSNVEVATVKLSVIPR